MIRYENFHYQQIGYVRIPNLLASFKVSSTGEPSQLEPGSDASPESEERIARESQENAREENVSETTSVHDQPEVAESVPSAEGNVAAGEEGPSEAGDVEDVAAVDDERGEPPEAVLSLVRETVANTSADRRERRFACPFCGKCVRSKENLKLHVRKHTGERPFVCLFCGRAFGGKSDLTRHLRIHTGERPYHCEMCGKCFARADYLSKHLTTHIHQR